MSQANGNRRQCDEQRKGAYVLAQGGSKAIHVKSARVLDQRAVVPRLVSMFASHVNSGLLPLCVQESQTSVQGSVGPACHTWRYRQFVRQDGAQPGFVASFAE